MRDHIHEGALVGGDGRVVGIAGQSIGQNVGGASADVAALVHCGDGDPMEPPVVCGQCGGERAAFRLPVEGHGLAVPGEGDGGGGKALIHVVGNIGGELGAVHLHCHGGRRGIGQVLIGGGKLIQVEGTDGLLAAAVDDVQGADGGRIFRQGGGDLLPAGEVQAGEHNVAGGAAGIRHSSGKGVDGAVAVDPKAQIPLAGGDDQVRLYRGSAALGGVVVHPDAALAVPHQIGRGLDVDGSGGGTGEGGEARVGLKGVQLLDVAGHRNGNGNRAAAGADGQIARAALGRGGENAVFIHRAGGGIGSPDIAGVLGGEGDFFIDGAGLQVHALERGEGQGGDGGAGGLVGERDGIRCFDHGDGGRPLRVAGRGGDQGGAALAARGKDAAYIHQSVSVADGPGDGAAVGEREAVLIHGGGSQGHLRAGEDDRVIGGDVEVVQCASRLQVGDQENAVGDGSLGAAGGHIQDLHAGIARHGGADGGRTASVQPYCVHTAQLDEPLGHLGERGADAVAALVAVDGVKDHASVCFDADGGAGIGGVVGLGTHRSIGDDAVIAADGGDCVVPAGIRAGHVDVHLVAGLEALHHAQQPLVVLLVDGEDHLPGGDIDGSGGFQHLVHGAGYPAAHFQRV